MAWWHRNTDYPAWYRSYRELIADEGYSDAILSIDMETTGIEPKTADILSYGSIPLRDRKVLVGEEVHLFFNGGGQTEETIMIHELFSHTTENVFLDFLPGIIGQIGNKHILGHYVAFDVALINAHLNKLSLPKLTNPTLDTLSLAIKKDGITDYRYARREDYSLYTLCNRYGIDVEYTHDALQDAYLTALLYCML